MNRDRSILLYDNVCLHTANRTQLKILELDLETDNFLQGKIFNSHQAVEIVFRFFISSRPLGFYAKDINELPLKWQ